MRGKLKVVIEGKECFSVYERFHGPADNIPLPDEELARCRSVLDRCRRIALEAPGFVATHGLDPEIALRGGNWGIEKVSQYFDRLVAGSEMSINHLRLLTYLFTGNRLFDFTHFGSHEWDKEIPVQLPGSLEELDRRVRSNEDKLFELETLSSFLTTIHRHPELPVPHVPPIFGEVGWVIDGLIFNDDVYVNYTYLQGLAHSGILDFLRDRTEKGERVRIVEIGPGWGFLAYNLKRLIPNAQYVFIDIPESIVYSYLYISTLNKSERNILIDESNFSSIPDDFDSLFVPSHLAPLVVGDLGPTDLVLNTTSLPEMHPKQIEFYAEVVTDMIGDTGLFFEVNAPSTEVISQMSRAFKHRHAMETREANFYMNFYYRATPNIWSNVPASELLKKL